MVQKRRTDCDLRQIRPSDVIKRLAMEGVMNRGTIAHTPALCLRVVAVLHAKYAVAKLIALQASRCTRELLFLFLVFYLVSRLTDCD
jgi:hypothetical protein